MLHVFVLHTAQSLNCCECFHSTNFTGHKQSVWQDQTLLAKQGLVNRTFVIQAALK